MRENDTKLILEKRFEKLSKHYEALKDYKLLIDQILLNKNIYEQYIAGINSLKMSEVLYYIEKEEIIDGLENWIELREVRNELEHYYTEELEEALMDLKFC
jgi:hypothetical protein